jgi:hypothetical protein
LTWGGFLLVDEIGQARDALGVVVGHVVCILFGAVRLEQLPLGVCQFFLGQLESGRWLK